MQTPRPLVAASLCKERSALPGALAWSLPVGDQAHPLPHSFYSDLEPTWRLCLGELVILPSRPVPTLSTTGGGMSSLLSAPTRSSHPPSTGPKHTSPRSLCPRAIAPQGPLLPHLSFALPVPIIYGLWTRHRSRCPSSTNKRKPCPSWSLLSCFQDALCTSPLPHLMARHSAVAGSSFPSISANTTSARAARPLRARGHSDEGDVVPGLRSSRALYTQSQNHLIARVVSTCCGRDAVIIQTASHRNQALCSALNLYELL